MGTQHLLTNRAFIYDQSRMETKALEECDYDERAGGWRWGPDRDFLVKSRSPNRPRPVTKKEDRETGEDQKGE